MKQFDRIMALYQADFDATWADTAPVDAVRFVVLDCESTGLDPRRHRLVSIGAVAVSEAQIDLGDTFEALLRIRHNNEATLVHGITRDQSRDGLDEPEAMAALLAYLRDAVLVGHHVGYDLMMIDAALGRHFGLQLRNRHIDTAALMASLERRPAGSDQQPAPQWSLDALCERFGVLPYDRHTAPGDAFLTAQVFLRLLRLAVRQDRGTLESLMA